MSFGPEASRDYRERVNKAAVDACRQDDRAHRIHFATTHKDQPKRSESPIYFGTFNVPFDNSVKPVFESETGYTLFRSSHGGFWRSIKSEIEFQTIRDWTKRQGTRVFLRDCLDLSIALDFNFLDPTLGQHTELGSLEGRAKHGQDQVAIEQLAGHYVEAICDLPRFRDAPYIAAVPPRTDKKFDLPAVLAARIAELLNRRDLTPCFSFTVGKQHSIKALSVDQKWDAWEAAGLTLHPCLDGRPSVILIDDKYQSGTTIQFVASRLYAAGAREVLGLCAVKTMRDSDNA